MANETFGDLFRQVQQNTVTKNPRSFSAYKLWGRGNFVHICFESVGCRFRRAGYCMMCDYGQGHNLTGAEVQEILEQVVEHWPNKISRMLLGSCGSIFDPLEMDDNVFKQLLEKLAQVNIDTILFETHYATVDLERLKLIKLILPGKNILIEMGLESSNDWVLRHSLNKYMDLRELTKKIDLIHTMGMNVILNVFLGAPLLTSEQQLDDSLQTIRWAFANGADEIVVFPSNIKPGTKLWQLYNDHAYTAPSHWLLLKLLSKLPNEQLERTSVSWYGDRQEIGVDTDILPPRDCPACHAKLMQFYWDYMKNNSGAYRRALLEGLYTQVHCPCEK